MIRIFLTSRSFGSSGRGGAAKSMTNIIEGLSKLDIFSIKILTFSKYNPDFKNVGYLKVNRFVYHLKKICSDIGLPFGIQSFLLIPQILRKIKQFNPHLIITQTPIAYPTIIASIIKKIPIIYIIRDLRTFCPKYTDIYEYRQACTYFQPKKKCKQCILRWKHLRVLIGDKAKGYETSCKSLLKNIVYYLRIPLVKLNFKLATKTSRNLLASRLVRQFFQASIENNNFLSREDFQRKFKIACITPIKKQGKLDISLVDQNRAHKMDKRKLDKILKTKKDTFLLYIISNQKNELIKGTHFIFSLSKVLPPSWKLIIVGKEFDRFQDRPRVINFGHIPLFILYKIYQKADITLVPSFFNETFGRIIIESIINTTPVITSPQCGASYFFEDKKYLKIENLRLSKWISAISGFIDSPPKITQTDVNEVLNKFSSSKSTEDFIRVIKGSYTF
ncbi:MAG: glycosyltransferase [Promethearchaeia archaeon]